MNSDSSEIKKDKLIIKLVFFGLAFFIVLIIVGILFLSQFMDGHSTTKDLNLEELQNKIEEPQKDTNDSPEEIIENSNNPQSRDTETSKPKTVEDFGDFGEFGDFEDNQEFEDLDNEFSL